MDFTLNASPLVLVESLVGIGIALVLLNKGTKSVKKTLATTKVQDQMVDDVAWFPAETLTHQDQLSFIRGLTVYDNPHFLNTVAKFNFNDRYEPWLIRSDVFRQDEKALGENFRDLLTPDYLIPERPPGPRALRPALLARQMYQESRKDATVLTSLAFWEAVGQRTN